MRKAALLLIVAALILVSSLHRADAGVTTVCPPDCLPSVYNSTTNCEAPSTCSEIASRCGLPEDMVLSCLKTLKEMNYVYKTGDTWRGSVLYCRASG